MITTHWWSHKKKKLLDDSQVKVLVMHNHRANIRILTDDVFISIDSVHIIWIKDLAVEAANGGVEASPGGLAGHAGLSERRS